MYFCLDCGYTFNHALKTYESHRLSSPPYEIINVCPSCKSQNFRKKSSDYCHYCGTKLKKGKIDYCSKECLQKGEKAWLKEKKRKKMLVDSPLYKRVREIQAYNQKNKTKYSYGQYTAIVKGGK